MDHFATCVRLPACIVGLVQEFAPHDQVELITLPTGPGVTIQMRAVAHSTLITTLCQLGVWSLFQIQLNRHTSTAVEYLAPLGRIWPNTTMTGSIVDQTAHAGYCAHQFAFLNIALILNCLMDCCAETLAETCSREPWLVAKS